MRLNGISDNLPLRKLSDFSQLRDIMNIVLIISRQGIHDLQQLLGDRHQRLDLLHPTPDLLFICPAHDSIFSDGIEGRKEEQSAKQRPTPLEICLSPWCFPELIS